MRIHVIHYGTSLKGLGIDLEQVHVKASSMDGNDEIARLEGIEARVIVSLWVDV